MSPLYQGFREEIWSRLPAKKHKAGKEVVLDLIDACVQEFPAEEFAQSNSGETGELKASWELCKSIKRHAAVLYGEKFSSLWLIALQVLVPIIIELILQWWRRDGKNRRRLAIWRSRWRD
jgi:hypothetical protein